MKTTRLLACAAAFAALAALAPAAPPPALAASAQAEPQLDVPYVPTPHETVALMLDMAEVGPGDYVIDLGSGDGRIPVAAAERGARGFGVDINPVRVREANERASAAGVADRVRFRRQDLFKTPIAEATVLTMYLLPRVNMELRPRILTELRPGTRVVSHAFDMGDWEADRTEDTNGARVFLWIVPAPVGGSWSLALPDGRTLPLELEQRFQQVVGTLGGRPLEAVSLRGEELRFVADTGSGRHAFRGRWDGAVIAADPAGDGALAGWTARRVR